MDTARALQKVGFILVIIGTVIDAFFIPETFGLALICLILGVIAIVKLSKFNNYDDEAFIANKSTLLVWGLVALFFSFGIGGLLTVIAYVTTPDGQTAEGQTASNEAVPGPMSLEHAFDLKQKGALTDQEYEEIKKQILSKE